MRPSTLSDNKRALLAQRLQKARVKKSKPQAIGRRPENLPAQLSFPQRRLWFLSQWEPDNPAYNMRSVLRLVGDLNVDALNQAFNAILQRHQVLQMIYNASDAVEDGEPIQVNHPDPSLTLQRINLQTLPDGEREAELRRLATAEIHRPFDI
ncbi:MAG: condensation protein, partial [bacterium]|nr:condensation protein [bacterium]